MQMAKSSAVRRSVTFTLRQGRWASRKMNRLTVPLRRYSQSKRSRCPGTAWIGCRTSPMSWVGLSSKQTTGRFGSGACAYRSSTSSMRATYSPSICGMHHLSLRHGLRSFSVSRRRTVSREMLSCSVSLTSSSANFQGPTGATLRWVGTGGRDQQGFLFARELAGRARTRLFTQRLFQIAHQEAPLGPVHGRPAHADADRDVLVAGARVGSQQNLRALELARRMLAAAQERREFAALGLAEFDAVAYIHMCLLAVRGTNERLNRMSGVWRPQKVSRPSRASIWRSSTHTRACTAGRRPKPTCSNISGSAHLQFTRWCARSNGQGSFADNRGSLATSKSSLIRSTCKFYADPQINPSKPLC